MFTASLLFSFIQSYELGQSFMLKPQSKKGKSLPSTLSLIAL